MKKHVCQMTDAEIKRCIAKVNRVASHSWMVCRHAAERMKKKGVTAAEIYYTLQSFDIVEYKIVPEERVVIRSGEVVIVLSIKRETIITVWRNAINDNHKTLDMREYDEKLVVR